MVRDGIYGERKSNLRVSSIIYIDYKVDVLERGVLGEIV